MEFKLEGGALRATENPEEVESLKFDTFQIALMRFRHTCLTVELTK